MERKRQVSNESGRKLLDRFVLQEKIGTGGMGDIYKALDLRRQEAGEELPYLAIKVLNPKFAERPDAFIALQREASKTRPIASKNIVQVYDFDRDEDLAFMEMEILDGEPLDQYLVSYPNGAPREKALQIIDELCQGLIEAHAHNIVHSDIKPANLFCTADGSVKLLDFGLARAVQNPGTAAKGDTQTVFDPGSLGALTPAYASYEMLSGEVPSRSCDVFAAALVAYEVLSGNHPFNRKPADHALSEGLVPKRLKILKGRQWRALANALALTRERRTESIEAFREGLLRPSMLSRVINDLKRMVGGN